MSWHRVPGVADLGVFQESGQPELLVSIDRAASARYGVMSADVDAAVQAAIGGLPATQILQGDRRFDFVIRYQPQFRTSPEAIRNILLPTPTGNNVPLGQVADVSLRQGAFMIFRENGRRYIPVKFSVRGRDLAGTIQEVQSRLAQKVHLPEGYHLEWAGEYDSLQKEQRRLAVIIPITLLIILALLFTAFNSLASRSAGSRDSPIWPAGRNSVAAGDPHALQHLRSGWICIRDWSLHSWRRRVCFGHSPEGGRLPFIACDDRARLAGRDAAGRDGVRRGVPRFASRSGFDGHRRPGSAAARSRGRRRHDHFAAGDSFSDTCPRQLLAAVQGRTRRWEHSVGIRSQRRAAKKL